jgi:hypothetical protein
MMLMEINSVVDYPTKIAAFCFRLISSAEKIDFVGPEIGFGRRFAGDSGDRTRPPEDGSPIRRPLPTSR